MFEALRWRLTAWYVVAFAVVFAVVGVIVFLWARQRLSHDVDAAIRNVSDSARRVASADGPDIADSEERVRDQLIEANLSGSADVFVLLLGPDGRVVANPSDVPLVGLPDVASVERARAVGEDWREHTASDQDLQVRTVSVYDQDGNLIGFVQAGKSLEERDRSLRTLVLVMAGGGLTGAVLATAGGLFVAGIAIRPIRRSFLRQREFVADASHELRTPLAVIRTNSESLAIERPDDEAIADIAMEAAYMSRLLDDLLMLAGSDQEGILLQLATVDLAGPMQAAAHAGATLARNAGLEFRADIERPLWADADEERVREVVLILLDNAVKYTRAGSVELIARRDGDTALIRVRDTGVGIGPEHIKRVFDRFYRVDKVRSRQLGGAGLGLSIAREIVDAHGGTIDVTSTPGAGTTVTVRLRLTRAQATAIASPHASEAL